MGHLFQSFGSMILMDFGMSCSLNLAGKVFRLKVCFYLQPLPTSKPFYEIQEKKIIKIPNYFNIGS
jgi:hypothetical protein